MLGKYLEKKNLNITFYVFRTSLLYFNHQFLLYYRGFEHNTRMPRKSSIANVAVWDSPPKFDSKINSSVGICKNITYQTLSPVKFTLGRHRILPLLSVVSHLVCFSQGPPLLFRSSSTVLHVPVGLPFPLLLPGLHLTATLQSLVFPSKHVQENSFFSIPLQTPPPPSLFHSLALHLILYWASILSASKMFASSGSSIKFWDEKNFEILQDLSNNSVIFISSSSS
ncbi:hypothetical protein Avbf_14586 [Armadillidium vulgare]|nr:hypothetical protein Avbf_14586 [Armadillidium vulgare]